MKNLTGLLVGLAIGAVTAWGLTSPAQTPTPSPDLVATYNDGWATSKQDDCDNGSQFACHWLNGN